MTTLTQRKRNIWPQRYERKDARNKIYAALFGNCVGHDPKGQPELNDQRKLPYHFTFVHAEQVFNTYESKAKFSAQQYAALTKRLESLRHFKA